MNNQIKKYIIESLNNKDKNQFTFKNIEKNNQFKIIKKFIFHNIF